MAIFAFQCQEKQTIYKNGQFQLQLVRQHRLHWKHSTQGFAWQGWLRQKDYFGSIDSIEKAVNNHNELYILPFSFS